MPCLIRAESGGVCTAAAEVGRLTNWFIVKPQHLSLASNPEADLDKGFYTHIHLTVNNVQSTVLHKSKGLTTYT